ncbi:MAG: HDOD domain-containing protein [Desulfobacteraceae bacterium]|nr:HDOD domain-containing protein [Desulfobacteraceae bacterium]
MAYQNTEHIAAGQYRVGKQIENIYQAYLGTCLGVAIYDKSKKIGGMIHILLPDPPSLGIVEFPEKYASTGVPLLISELLNLGARLENLKATIAGGALVGPVSQQDINLDIGGRSTEIVVTFLETAGIKVIKSETGGFFTCTLELDMKTGTTQIKPAWEETCAPQRDFSVPRIEEINDTIENLKPIPQTALKILRMVQNPGHDVNDITQELSKDQVLSGKTLKICNSVLFAGTAKIDTLKDAVLLLGEHLLIQSVIIASVNNYFKQTETSGYSLCKGGLFFHAVGVGATAEKIAQISNRSTPKQAYTAGLLHDIGKVVLDQYISHTSPLFFRDMDRYNKNFLEAEKNIIGITHCETGALLAKRWDFSNALSQVISHHHTPEKAGSDRDLICIVYLADMIMGKFSAGFDLDNLQIQSLNFVLKTLGLTPNDIPGIVDAIPLPVFEKNTFTTSRKDAL